MTWWVRPAARQWKCEPPARCALALHECLPGYAPTPLAELPALAAELGVGRVFVKDESARFGLGAFKALGASWAVATLLAGRAGETALATASPATGRWSLGGLRDMAAVVPATLVTATDGNHGRAVAWMAGLVGLRAEIVVPEAAGSAVADAIEALGAAVTVSSGDYDQAVRQAASLAAGDPSRLLVQDTGWPGYTAVPARVVEGYETMLAEADEQLHAAGVQGPDLVVVPVGVGSLAQAVVAHCRGRGEGRPGGGRPGSGRPASGVPGGSDGPASVMSVEPDTAACVLASMRARELTSVLTARTLMAGLNCGTPSSLCWPVLRAGLDAAIAVSDAAAKSAVEDLASLGVSAGPSGAAALAGARAALTGDDCMDRRAQLGLRAGSTVLLLSTEGGSAAAAG